MNASFEESSKAATFELNLPNKLSELERLNPWLDQCATTIGLSPRGTFRLELLLEEVVMNIFENAYPEGAEHLICVRLIAENAELVVRIEDDGVPFDPTVVPEQKVPTSLEDAQIGGVGLHLMHSYADRLGYERCNNKNILTLYLTDSDAEVTF